MQPPDELMVSAFLPAMRPMVARVLRDQGYTQSKIAAQLGVTQASVSIYLSAGGSRARALLGPLGVSEKEGERFAHSLAESVRKSPSEGIRALDLIWKGLLGNGTICPAHRAQDPTLANCDFCIVEYGRQVGSIQAAISEVSDAARLLESSPNFAAVMPEVSVNIAFAARGAHTSAEVVAIPGRMVKVKGRARAVLPPEAGASTHMSEMLLMVRKVNEDLRACINILYDRRMASVLKGLGIRTLSISSQDSRTGGDPAVAALGEALKTGPGPFEAVADLGGGGFEPNLYVFSTGPVEAAGAVLEIARNYVLR